jgi:hypothetical protein
MNTGQRNMGWKTIALAVGAAIIVTFIFATIYPWLALLSGMTLVAGGIAYAAWRPMSERIAHLRSLPYPSLQRRISIVMPIVLYGVVLLALSQSRIRANWQAAEVRAEVAREIEKANTALQQERADEALQICALLDSKANADEKTQLAAIRNRVQSIENANRTKAANAEVPKLVSDGRNHVLRQDLEKAQSALEAALNMPMATEFKGTTELANQIAAARTKLAIASLDAGDLLKAKEYAQQAMRVPSATETAESRRIITDISNHEVAMLVVDARKSIEKMNRDEAAATLEIALTIPDATETAEAQKMLAAISKARNAEATAQVSELMAQAERSIAAGQFDDATRTLNAALGVPHSSQNAEVTARIQFVQRQQSAENERKTAAMKAEEAKKAAAEADRRAEEEYEQNNLVLLRKTVQGKRGQFGGEITGTVINRSTRKLNYAEITFNLYDQSGAQVGTAVDNIRGLEPGGRWNFKATTFGTDFSGYKINELSGF